MVNQKDIRCPKCNRLLFKKMTKDNIEIIEKDNFEIEIKCPKCNGIIVLK